MLAVVFGLSAAFFYGAADFCGGLATRRTSMYSVVVISQLSGFVVLLAVLPFMHAHAEAKDLLWGALAGCCGGAGLALLYHALSIGKMGVVSPITAVLAAALPVVVGTVRGEHLAVGQCAGIALALGAIVLISFSSEENGEREFSTAGVREAVLSGIVLGGFYLFLANAPPRAGLEPLLAARLTSALLLLVLALVVRSDLRPASGSLRLILFAGVIDMTANVLYVLAATHGYLAIAAVLTSLYPASTVFLARIVLKERLALSQRLGLLLALAGVALIAM